jgi:Co/Zn/Cd efflux system component
MLLSNIYRTLSAESDQNAFEEIKQPQIVLIAACVGLAINLFALVLFCGHGGHAHSHGHSHGDEEGSDSSHEENSHHDHDEEHDHDHKHEHEDHEHDHHGHDHKKGGSTMYSVFLHVLGDALGSIAVIVSTCLIWLTDWSWRHYIDPITRYVSYSK